ncbi:MAG: hypothetical protein HY688_01235, partial [Chloroflexi bacterium]|nr:hypothetical protein [Chloroflexota bacterium]
MMAILGLLAVALIALAILLGGPVVAEAVRGVLEAFLPDQVVAPLMV